MDKLFVIGLDGLKAGRSHFTWHADGKFFGDFENSEILDADLDVDAEVEKMGASILVDSRVKGAVTVACDRCLEDLILPVEARPAFSVKFGTEAPEGEDEIREGSREILCLDASDADLDLSQVIYDYVCLALPMQRVHAEGECNPDTVKFLSEGAGNEEAATTDSPFSALKGLFAEDKQNKDK